MRVRCLVQEHNAVPWPGLEPGPLDSESSALTILGNHKLLAVKKQNGEVDRHSLDQPRCIPFKLDGNVA